MIDTMRPDWPADMTRAAEFPDLGTLESMANDALGRLKEYAREHPTSFAL